MKVQIVSEDVELNDQVRELIEKKLGPKIDKYLQSFDEDIKMATVRLKKLTRHGYEASLSMYLPGKEHIFAKEEGEDLTLAVVAMRKDVIRQIKEYKAELRGNR